MQKQKCLKLEGGVQMMICLFAFATAIEQFTPFSLHVSLQSIRIFDMLCTIHFQLTIFHIATEWPIQ